MDDNPNPTRKIKRALARTNQTLIRLETLLTMVGDLRQIAGIPQDRAQDINEARIHLRMMGEALADFTKKNLNMTPEELEVYR